MKVPNAEVRAAYACRAKLITAFPGTALPDVRYEILFERAAKWLEFGVPLCGDMNWLRVKEAPEKAGYVIDILR